MGTGVGCRQGRRGARWWRTVEARTQHAPSAWPHRHARVIRRRAPQGNEAAVGHNLLQGVCPWRARVCLMGGGAGCDPAQRSTALASALPARSCCGPARGRHSGRPGPPPLAAPLLPHTHVLADPERRGAALETIQKGVLTLQGPMVLKQGWVGVVPRLPIFVENVTDPNERFGCAPAPRRLRAGARLPPSGAARQGLGPIPERESATRLIQRSEERRPVPHPAHTAPRPRPRPPVLPTRRTTAASATTPSRTASFGALCPAS